MAAAGSYFYFDYTCRIFQKKLIMRALIVLAAVTLLAAASCKKKTDESVKAKLTGKWKYTKAGYDANSNGIADATELQPIPDSVDYFITFNNDGTGTGSHTSSGTTVSTPFTWQLINSDKDFVITTTEPGASGSHSDTAHVESLTSTDLEFSTKAINGSGGSITTWAFFHKQ